MPFEEWIYGHPPQDVQFVRVNGNRVIRVELAKLGQPLAIFTKDEVEGLMTTDGKPVLAEATRTVQMGDVHRDPNTQSAEAPPTLRAPGEKLPDDKSANTPGTMNREGTMQPVVFPKDTTKDAARTVDAHPDAAKPDATKPDPDKKAADSTDPAKKDASATDAAKPATGSDPAKSPARPETAPTQAAPTPPASNFYSDTPQPTAL